LDQWIALLKGVNVGGNNRIKSADLAKVCRDLGWADVSTLLASGNIVFRANSDVASSAQELSGALKTLGLSVKVAVIGAGSFRQSLADCPFDPEEGKLVHGHFCLDTPTVDMKLFETLAESEEEIAVHGDVVWLFTPLGFSASKVSEKFGKIVGGTQMTARNLNTLRRLAEKLDR